MGSGTGALLRQYSGETTAAVKEGLTGARTVSCVAVARGDAAARLGGLSPEFTYENLPIRFT